MHQHNLPAGSRVIGYVRVSTEEQTNGWSPKDQEDTLKEVARSNGWQVVKVCRDLGDSGMFLDRVGLDEARDLVEAGGVDALVSLYRSRISRKNSHIEFLRKSFKRRGAQVIALNSDNDGSPSGFLHDNIVGLFDEHEAMVITERMRRGKLKRAREGHILGSHTPPYGFDFDATRRALLPEPATASIVRRIFQMIGTEGRALHAVKKTFDREGIPTPGSSSSSIPGDCIYWQKTFIGRLVRSDLYFPHDEDDLDALVAEGVLASSVRERWRGETPVGVWWFNSTKSEPHETRTLVVQPDGSKAYRTNYAKVARPRAEWIAVPVPSLEITRSQAERARARVSANVRPALLRDDTLWELSGGLTRCGHCGRRVYVNSTKRKGKPYRYYRCPTVRDHGSGACDGGNWGADFAEPLVWSFVKNLLSRPDVVIAAVDARIEEEERKSRTDVSEDFELWHAQLTKSEAKRDRYIELYAEGILDRDERDAKLSSVDAAIRSATEALERLASHSTRIAEMKSDRETLKRSYRARGLDSLENLTSERKRRLYEILNLEVELLKDPELKGKVRGGKDMIVRVRGRIVEGIWGDNCTFRDVLEIASMYNFTNRMSLACGKLPNEEYHALFR